MIDSQRTHRATTEDQRVGDRLAQARIQAGLTQVEVGRITGMPQSTIAKLESGARTLKFYEGIRLATLYRVELSAFVPGGPTGHRHICSDPDHGKFDGTDVEPLVNVARSSPASLRRGPRTRAISKTC